MRAHREDSRVAVMSGVQRVEIEIGAAFDVRRVKIDERRSPPRISPGDIDAVALQNGHAGPMTRDEVDPFG